MSGLDEAFEWDAFRSLLPEFRDKRVLDLGCGFGWHCRYARQQQASSVVGIDLSENMLARARADTDDTGIVYMRSAVEDIDFHADEFDVVVSSLTLHYIERVEIVCQKINHCLIPGGTFVLSVEHPVFTALAGQEWYFGPDGERSHWPLDDYQKEGPRQTRWLADNVVKHHRTVATYVNTLVDTGFQVMRLLEPEPPLEMLRSQANMRDESRRPMFLLIAAKKAP